MTANDRPVRSITSERTEPARRSPCSAFRRRSLHETHDGRSALAAGTALHAPAADAAAVGADYEKPTDEGSSRHLSRRKLVEDAAVLECQMGNQASLAGHGVTVRVAELVGSLAQFEDSNVRIRPGPQCADTAFKAEDLGGGGGGSQHHIIEGNAEMKQLRHRCRHVENWAPRRIRKGQISRDRIR